jgi:hypothetical protein
MMYGVGLVSLSAAMGALARTDDHSLPDNYLRGEIDVSLVQRTAHLSLDYSISAESLGKSTDESQAMEEAISGPNTAKDYSVPNADSLKPSREMSFKPDAGQDLKDRLSIYRFFKEEPWEVTRARAIHALEEWVMRLRDFMLLFGWTAMLGVFHLNLRHQRMFWRLPRLQSIEIQILLCLLVLGIFPSITSHSTQRCVMKLAARYLVEGYLLLVVVYVIPLVLGEYADLAEQEELERKPMKTTHKSSHVSVPSELIVLQSLRSNVTSSTLESTTSRRSFWRAASRPPGAEDDLFMNAPLEPPSYAIHSWTRAT